MMLVTYRAVRTDSQTGKRTTTLRSSLWIRKLGPWCLRFHQGTREASDLFTLDFAAAEDIILIAVWTFRAFQAAN
jgi:hypothetical protein